MCVWVLNDYSRSKRHRLDPNRSFSHKVCDLKENVSSSSEKIVLRLCNSVRWLDAHCSLLRLTSTLLPHRFLNFAHLHIDIIDANLEIRNIRMCDFRLILFYIVFFLFCWADRSLPGPVALYAIPGALRHPLLDRENYEILHKLVEIHLNNTLKFK